MTTKNHLMSTPTLHLRFSHQVLSSRKTLTLMFAEEGFWMFWEGEGDAALFHPRETIAPFEAALASMGMTSRSDLQEDLRQVWFSLYEHVHEISDRKPDLDTYASDLVRFIEAVNAIRPPELTYTQPPNG